MVETLTVKQKEYFRKTTYINLEQSYQEILVHQFHLVVQEVLWDQAIQGDRFLLWVQAGLLRNDRI